MQARTKQISTGPQRSKSAKKMTVQDYVGDKNVDMSSDDVDDSVDEPANADEQLERAILDLNKNESGSDSDSSQKAMKAVK